MIEHCDECDGAGCPDVEEAPDCIDGLDHRWTRRGCGGCDENPGVWSLGGTAMRYEARCLHCGCGRVVVDRGWQRNPGECDSVRYAPEEYAPDADALRHARRLRRRRENAARRRALAIWRRYPLACDPMTSGMQTARLLAPQARYATRAALADLIRWGAR